MPMVLRGVSHTLWLAGLCLLAGCASVGPDYTAPQVELADRWQAALPHAGETGTLLGWWMRFNDPVLTELLIRAEADSPNLAEAVARIDEARAGLTVAGAGHLPVVNAGVQSIRNNIATPNVVPAQTTRSATIDAAWEIDIFGRVRRSGEAADARLEMQENNWHAARVSLAAEVAGKYVDYRACRLLAQAFTRDVKSRQESARITDIAAQAGLVAPADAQLARAGAADTASALTAQQAVCDIAVKSLVTLTDMNEPAMRRLLQEGRAAIPQPVAFSVDSLPVALLSQRPDLAASERELAAASADIGVAEASRFPRLSLLGNLEVDKTRIGGASNGTTIVTKPWSFGPALSLPLFNGGALAARQSEAEARYAQALARYRKATRAAVEEVETALVNLDSATQRAAYAHTASESFSAYFKAAETNWHSGGLSLLLLEEARRSATAAERNEIMLQRDQVLHWIALYKALGGGWNTAVPAETSTSSASTDANMNTNTDTKNPPPLNTPGEPE